MDLKATYNKIAEDWFKDHHGDTWWQEGTEKFLAELPEGATILDVGCGASVMLSPDISPTKASKLRASISPKR